MLRETITLSLATLYISLSLSRLISFDSLAPSVYHSLSISVSVSLSLSLPSSLLLTHWLSLFLSPSLLLTHSLFISLSLTSSLSLYVSTITLSLSLSLSLCLCFSLSVFVIFSLTHLSWKHSGSIQMGEGGSRGGVSEIIGRHVHSLSWTEVRI